MKGSTNLQTFWAFEVVLSDNWPTTFGNENEIFLFGQCYTICKDKTSEQNPCFFGFWIILQQSTCEKNYVIILLPHFSLFVDSDLPVGLELIIQATAAL
jgi:hypothetical protein